MRTILIPAKSKSVRCPRKNFTLLPFVAEWIRNEGVDLNNVVVICDNEEMGKLARENGLKVFYEISPMSGDIIAVRDCAITLGLKDFIWLPLTSPLRSHGLLAEMEQAFDNINLVVTIQKIHNRSLFYVNEKGFETESYERKGCMCDEKLMIDGAAYMCNTEWLKNVEGNNGFWREPFKCVTNHAPFLDIDTEEDMLKFQNLKEFFI